MSGLLSKANAVEETVEETVENEVKAETVAQVSPAVHDGGGPDVPTILKTGGWTVIIIGGLLSLQGGFWGLIVVLVVLVLGIGALYGGQALSEEGVNPVKMGGAALLAVLLAAGPYGVSMLMPADSIGITDLEIKEESNEITFRVIGSASEVDATVTANGAVMWTGAETMSSESARFNIPLEEIFIGNSWSCGLSSCDVNTNQVEYILEVSSGDTTQSVELNPEFMTREVKDSGVRITPIIKQEANDDDGNDKRVEGILVEMQAGLLPSSHIHQDGGSHSQTGGLWVESDYTLELIIKKGSTVVYGSTDCSNPSIEGFPQIVVEGTDGISCKGDSGVTVNGWFSMPGDANDDAAGEYLSLEGMDYSGNGDGCYTFEVRIHNTFYEGMNDPDSTATGIVVDSDVKWDLDFEDYNDNPNSNKPNPSMNTCE
jgi:hypothetical protein